MYLLSKWLYFFYCIKGFQFIFQCVDLSMVRTVPPTAMTMASLPGRGVVSIHPSAAIWYGNKYEFQITIINRINKSLYNFKTV